jgi:copper(I)-binding protein
MQVHTARIANFLFKGNTMFITLKNQITHQFIRNVVLGVASLILCAAHAKAPAAEVDIQNAWVRPTVAGQMGTGGFMNITARQELQLVGVSTPITKTAEIHEMRSSKTDPSVMEMRPINSLALPKGKTIELKPGSYHLMLMDLKQVLPAGTNVPLTLFFKDAKGQASQLDLTLPVGRPTQGAGSGASDAAMPAKSHGMHKH